MIVVRDVFRLQFGKSRDALALAKEGLALEEKFGYKVDRVLTDVTGEYYTLVMESLFNSLAELEEALTQMSQHQEWRDWYARFTPLVRSGHREIFRVVER